MSDGGKWCIRCKTCCDDYHTITLTDNFNRAEPYSRMTSVKEAEATFCEECAQAITSVFWGQV